jgi:hypothetical protein
MQVMRRNPAEQVMSRCAFEEARAVVLDRDVPQVIFLIRERSAMIRYLGETRLEVRGRLYLPDDCVLLLVLLKVGRHLPRIYPTWWNYLQPGQAEAFHQMQQQELLAAHFHGDNARRERSFLAENPCRGLFAQAVLAASRKHAWSATCFECHRQRIVGHAGSVETLWKECAPS